MLHLGAVVEGHGKQVGHRAAGAEADVFCAVDHPWDSGIDNSACAHGAGLQSHIQGTLPQPPATQSPAGFVDGFDLCMGKGVFAQFSAVAATADDSVTQGDHAANRDFTLCGGFFGKGQRLPHHLFIHAPTSFFLIIRKNRQKVNKKCPEARNFGVGKNMGSDEPQPVLGEAVA